MKKPKHITIIGRRWFQKTYGNTYHSVTIKIRFNKNFWRDIYIPFSYGYDSQYLNTAFEALKKDKIIPESWKYSDFIQDIRDNRHKYLTAVVDVSRKKDL